jgi:hypothetical protein
MLHSKMMPFKMLESQIQRVQSLKFEEYACASVRLNLCTAPLHFIKESYFTSCDLSTSCSLDLAGYCSYPYTCFRATFWPSPAVEYVLPILVDLQKYFS